MENTTIEDVKAVHSVIKQVAENEVRKAKFPTFIAAIVQKVNADGTVDVYIPPSKKNMVTNVLNKSGELLQVGDSVEIETKSGSLSNCWVDFKHGTNVQGTYGEVQKLSAQVVMKVVNGRLITTELMRPAELGNSFTIQADDINLDGMNINLNGTKGITITSPHFSVTKEGYITASGATITGEINATSGNIGGCTISNGTLRIKNANIDSLSVGKITAGTNSADVTFNEITCDGGYVGGWTIDNTRLSSGSGENFVALDSGTTNTNYAIWAGNENSKKAPFKVARNGYTEIIDDSGLWGLFPKFRIKSDDDSYTTQYAPGSISQFQGSTLYLYIIPTQIYMTSGSYTMSATASSISVTDGNNTTAIRPDGVYINGTKLEIT